MEIRDLDVERDLDAALDVRTRSFGTLPEHRHEHWRGMVRRAAGEGRILACYDDAELVATARINRYAQWWHGQAVPMAGVAGVVVAPEHRGRGVGRLLMDATLRRSVDLGFVLSALYPATLTLYRSCGWEIAGAQHLVSVPTEALRSLATGPVAVRRVGPDDAADILSVVRRVHASARSSGPIDWEAEEVRDWLTEDKPFCYLAEDGFLAYHWEELNLEVDELVAGSPETARALWSIVGSGSSVARTVKACVGPNDPLRLLVREEVVRRRDEKRWMLRLLDVPAALTGRGYPVGVEAELLLAVDDPQLPENTGAWRLTVSKGAGRVEPAEATGAVTRLGARGLAALYAGAPLATLRVAGLVTAGDPDTDALLDSVFTAHPYLLDYF